MNKITMKFTTLLAWAGLLCVLICMACSNLMNIAGSGSSTGNAKVSGSIVTESGSPATATLVQCIPQNYDPGNNQSQSEILLDTTSEGGYYEFIVFDSVRYNIQAVNLDTRERLLHIGVPLFKEDVRNGVDTLRKPGSIQVLIPDSADKTNGYVYIPGTNISASLSPGNAFVLLDSVPAGKVPPVHYAVKSGPALFQSISDTIAVVSNSTAVLPPPGWKFTKRLFLNTTATGAHIAASVHDFPVLVRLTKTNFNFGQAAKNGDDVRFTKSNGVALPYEIERWDSAGGVAELWVKLDTIFGNNGTQYIIMCWGLRSTGSVTSASNSASVFDTAKGFQGVWHLNEAGNTTAKDATFNHYDGTPSGMTAVSALPGTIGGAQQFDGIASYIEMIGSSSGKLDFPENGTYMVSAWVYADTLDGIHDEIASKGWFQYFLEIGSKNTWEFNVLKDGVGWENASAPASAKVWTYVVGIRSDTSQYLYVNGTCVDSVKKIGNVTIDLRSSGDNFKIGTHRGPTDPYPWFFKGKIDEVRVQSSAPNADWIKLNYLNQKAQDALVVFK
jgi:hypothetical protein